MTVRNRVFRAGICLALVAGLLSSCESPGTVLAGTVTTSTGQGLGQVFVELFPVSAPSLPVANTTTNFAGNYEFNTSAVADGQYYVNFNNLWWTGTGVSTNINDAAVVALANGALVTANAQLGAFITFTGRVVNSSDAPIANQVVAVTDTAGDVVAFNISGMDGTFSLDAVEVHQYDIDQYHIMVWDPQAKVFAYTDAPVKATYTSSVYGQTIALGDLSERTATQVAVGVAHACAIISDGSVACWGDNNYNELGYPSGSEGVDPNVNSTPLMVNGITNAAQISAGGTHTCALLVDQTVKCWGSNKYGELGTSTNSGTDIGVSTPTTVAGISNATQISAGAYHSCALLSDHTVKCWGQNFGGQLGNTTNNGNFSANPTPTTVDGITTATQIFAGNTHTCAILADQTIKCWGNNFYGQLGNPTNVGNDSVKANPTPLTVDGITNAVQVDGGSNYTCAILADQTVKCWGNNTYGQLGNATGIGTFNGYPTPTTVGGVTTATQITTSRNMYASTCALLADQTVKCWGFNQFGQLGTSTNISTTNPVTTPTTVDGVTTATQIENNGQSTCAVLANQTIQCWGLNSNGELGNPNDDPAGSPHPIPTAVNYIPFMKVT